MTKRHWRKSELFDALKIDEDAKVINGKTIDDLLAEYLDPNWESLNLEDIAFIPYIKVQCFLCRIKGGYPYDADHMMLQSHQARLRIAAVRLCGLSLKVRLLTQLWQCIKLRFMPQTLSRIKRDSSGFKIT